MFAERLRALRKQRNLSQEQLAAIIGVERSSIGKYESKARIIPSDDVKYRIAEYFGVAVDYLLGYTDNPFPASAENALSDVELKLIDDFRSLNRQGKEYILQTMAMAVTIYKNGNISVLENIP